MQKPKGLKLRGEVWWIDKTIHQGDRKLQLRESTGCRAISDAIVVLERRTAEATHRVVRDETKERTFSEAAVEYILDLESRGKDTRRVLALMKSIMDAIGDLPLSHIHQTTLRPWIEAQRGVLASGTVKRTLQMVTTVLHLASQVLRDGHDPWLKTAPPRLRAPDWGTRRPRPISWEEQDRLIEVLPDHLVSMALFAIATGARSAEVSSLRWDQHRMVEGMPEWSAWWIPPEIRKGTSRKAASEQDGRYLVCNRSARVVILKQLGKHQEWVFPSPKGGAMYRITNSGWIRATRQVDLPIRVHDLRHTFGERAANAGIPLDIRRSLLGHEHRDITLHYSSPGLVRLLEEAERIVRPGSGVRLVTDSRDALHMCETATG